MKEKWTFENIPNLKGKVIIVTGGNIGLGYESVKTFAENNAEVILACRTVEKGEIARKKIIDEYPDALINVMKLDLADLKSIHVFAENFKKNYKKLDILLNNAGIMMVPYGKTKDGFELQLGTNHFGHFALTGLLLDYLKKTYKSRVVNVSSMAHKSGKMNFNNLMFEKGHYNPMKSYGNSKLANLLFTYELQRKFNEHNLDIISVAAHPGVSSTNLFKHLEKKAIVKIFKPLLLNIVAQPADIGALPQIRASVDLNVKGSEYYGPDGIREMRGYPIKVKSNEASHNKEDAKKLWDISEKLTKVKYDF